MTAPVPTRPTLAGELYYKALAVRAQLQAHDAEIALHTTRAALARTHAEAIAVGVPALEAECLAALGAAPGARFDWATLSVAEAPPAAGDGP